MSSTRQLLLTRLFIFMACFFLINCNESKKSGNSNGGSSGSRPDLTVSIATDLEDITAANAANFTVSGTCSEDGQPITVRVENLSPETAPICTDGAWMAEIDLTNLTGPSREVSITADHASSGGQNASQATGSALLPPRVFIDSRLLEDITSSNVANFTVSGTCSQDGQPITVVVGEGGVSPATAPLCTNGSWMAAIDLSSLTGPSREVSITADHATATQATGSTLLHPRVSVDTDLAEVTSTNADDFTVSGTCSEDGQPVTVVVGGVSPTTAPTCTTGAWSTRVNIASLTTAGSISITANHSTSNGLAALQATGAALRPPTVSVSTTLANITVSNVDDFTVSGTCSENGQPVTVDVEGVSPATAPTCATGAWTTKLDVTGLNKMAEVSITASHVSSDGAASAEATGSVTNNFTCPANYVGVPSLTSYTTNSFCVMKYEAKSTGAPNNNAISQASGTPYVSITRNDSKTRCLALNGENVKYDLITNDEWQTLARNIELVGDNWATGTVGNAGGLSRGHSDNSPGILAASSDDTQGCHGTEQICSNTVWNSQRRTHTLSNGEVIWDVAGNVSEWVKDTNNQSYGSNILISQVTATSHPTSNSLSDGTTTTSRIAKAQFGPSGDYSSLSTTPFGGLGYGYLNYNRSGVSRGGSLVPETAPAGVFEVNLSNNITASESALGFRCAYHP